MRQSFLAATGAVILALTAFSAQGDEKRTKSPGLPSAPTPADKTRFDLDLCEQKLIAEVDGKSVGFSCVIYERTTLKKSGATDVRKLQPVLTFIVIAL